jgi:hypothetical protein
MEIFMQKLFLAVLLPMALAAGGCERKTDAPKPKTGIGQPTSPTSAGRIEPKRAHLVRV